jgi:hypothetical protein
MSEAISGFFLSSATPHVAPLMRATTEIKSPGLAAGAFSRPNFRKRSAIAPRYGARIAGFVIGIGSGLGGAAGIDRRAANMNDDYAGHADIDARSRLGLVLVHGRGRGRGVLSDGGAGA